MIAGTCDRGSSRCHRSLGGAACPPFSLQPSKEVPFLRGIVIMPRSVINIHRGALLITFLINSMSGALVVGEGCGESGCAVVGAPSPCRIHPPLPNPFLGTVLKQSAKPQPLGLIAAGMGRVPLHDGTSHHCSATQGVMFSSAVARTRGDRMSTSLPHG